jgi:predicted kinase
VTALDIPDLALVALVGVSGSGKSTFARRHFAATQVLSSDTFRAMVADDENDQSASADAFDALHYVAGKRLRAGRLTVVDATNLQEHARAGLVALAREHDVLPVAVVLDVPEQICWERTQGRADRTFGRHVVTRMQRDLRRSIGRLAREGFRKVHVLGGVEEIDAAHQAVQRPAGADRAVRHHRRRARLPRRAGAAADHPRLEHRPRRRRAPGGCPTPAGAYRGLRR